MDKKYWENKYKDGETHWNIGYVSTPLKEYADSLEDKTIKVLIPGAGNAYEAEYLHSLGFNNVYVLEISSPAIENFKKRVPDFPAEHIIEGDFFTHTGKYDLILEQTFFCAIERKRRKEYAVKMRDLLNEGGKLAGLLFGHEFGKDEPPFGGTKEEYESIFSEYFIIDEMEVARNSIKPREGRELFFELTRR